MNSTIKTELISFGHTFLAVFLVAGLPMLVSFDYANADKAAISALFIAVIRSMVKALVEKLSTKNPENLG